MLVGFALICGLVGYKIYSRNQLRDGLQQKQDGDYRREAETFCRNETAALQALPVFADVHLAVGPKTSSASANRPVFSSCADFPRSSRLVSVNGYRL